MGGLLRYFKGEANERRECLSFCLWDSRAEARAAAGRPAHIEAAALTHEAYAEYTLEFLRVRRLEAGTFSFEPYDAVPAVTSGPTRKAVLRRALAPS